jgi:DNA mismatch endonuclease, patch repair protein
MDTVSTLVRSEIMRRVRSVDTKPELKIRRMIHAMGFRYRLYDKDLPGRPDLVFPSRRKAIFVNGCFWHGHDCEAAKLPATNVKYWRGKRDRNVARDRRNLKAIAETGWRALVVWECELRKPERTRKKILTFLTRTK